MVDYPQKIFSIHFPHKKVYIENTCKSIHDKMEYIKYDKDHYLTPEQVKEIGHEEIYRREQEYKKELGLV